VRPSARTLAAVALVAASFALRAPGVTRVTAFTGDEGVHVPAARSYATGHFTQSTWWNPPLGYLLLGASMAALGDGPLGWRARNLALGSLTPLLLLLLGLALFPGRPRIAWIAAWLLALDPLHVLLSRSTFEEIQGIFFFLAAAWLAALAARGRATLLPAGVALGCALASKHYFGGAALALVVFVLLAHRREGGPETAWASVLVSLVLVPAAVYFAAYLPWFARGYGLREFVELHLDLLRVERSMTIDSFANRELLSLVERAPGWFTRPTVICAGLGAEGGWGRFFFLGKNPAAWLLVLPAIAVLAALGLRRRDPGALLVAALFAVIYLPLLSVGRPIFVYSASVLLPFGFLAVGHGADLALARWRAAGAAALAAVFLVGAYVWPLAVGLQVPVGLYAPVCGAQGVGAPPPG